MIDCTTHEHLKGYYDKVPFTPFSSGQMLTNCLRRATEEIPKSMLTLDLRLRDKISVKETKSALERRFDIKKTVFDTQDDEYKKKQQELKAKRQEIFKREILPPISKRPEPEKRVDLSEEFEPSEEDSSEDLSEIDDKKDDSLYSKIKNKKYPMLNFKNPSSRDEEFKARRSESGSSSSSFMKTEKEPGSVATVIKGKYFRGLEQSEIAKQGGPDSDMTSTIRGAYNQITSIVEAQEFRFGKAKHLKREKTEGIEDVKDKTLQLRTEAENNLFKKISHHHKANHSPKMLEFNSRTERRQFDPIKSKKHKSDAGHLKSLHRIQTDEEEEGRSPSEYKRKVEPIDMDKSLEKDRFEASIPDIKFSGRV